MQRPELFAGVISVNGPMPESQAPLSCWEECRNLPVFLTQARKSQSFDQATLCRQLKLLHVAGFALTLRQYPGEESLNEKLLQDVNRWIMEAVNAPELETQRRAK
jgi:phospholipase/carboxylesterase